VNQEAIERASERANEVRDSRERLAADARRRKPAVVRTYRDLLVWQRAMELADAVYQHTSHFPRAETFGLSMQLRRAVVSIASNIAEGHARQSRSDYLRFLRMARGSIAEVETQLEIASRQQMPGDAPPVLSLAHEVAIMLQSLIRKLEAKGNNT
jgi:four helix bundle protein